MTPTLTDEQVVRCLAEREGWQIGEPSMTDYKTRDNYQVFVLRREGKFVGERTMNGLHKAGVPSYLTSRDALAPVLEGLSEEEWHFLCRHLSDISPGQVMSFHRQQMDRTVQWVLTLPARDLAHAVAAVLVGGKEAGK